MFSSIPLYFYTSDEMVYIVFWVFYFYSIIYFRDDINILYLIYYDVFDI